MGKLIIEIKFNTYDEILPKLYEKQRQCMEAIMCLNKMVTVNDIKNYLNSNGKWNNPDNATIYSCLKYLVGIGFINKINVNDSKLYHYQLNNNTKIFKQKIKNINDITNEKYGKLTVKRYLGLDDHNQAIWYCECDCGGNRNVRTSKLKSGEVISCGCTNYSMSKENSTTHGMTHTSIFSIWGGMKARCDNPNHVAYNGYGGRGITVCERWLMFENFMEDMYESYLKHCEEFGEDNTSIDRIDVNGNYEPSNCKWATRQEQQNNTRKNIFITLNEETHTVAEWSRIYEVSRYLVYGRLHRGWEINERLFSPPKSHKLNK
jgi:Fe2+ or Zn2+ uptake regulation protein